MSRICIIPARGGSKRIPKKNIKELDGKPLLNYTIDVAKDSNVFDKIVVSSDSDEILEIAKNSGVSIHKRDPNLAGDNDTVFNFFYHFVNDESIKNNFDSFAGMLVTCPFKKTEHIKGAYNLFDKYMGEKNLISITDFDYPPQFGFTESNDDEIIMTHPEAFDKTTRSQNMSKIVHNNGAIWISKIDNYLKNKTFYKGKMIGYKMDAISSFDIDYQYQFDIAEVLAQKIKRNEI